MKTVPLTIRGCPSEVHQALKKSATVNHRSLNGETVAWLERQAARKPVTGKEAAAILREVKNGLSAKDRRAIARGIEEARRRMAHEPPFNIGHFSRIPGLKLAKL